MAVCNSRLGHVIVCIFLHRLAGMFTAYVYFVAK